MSKYKLSYSGEEIDANLAKTDDFRKSLHYPIIFTFNQASYVVLSNYTWRELADLGLYDWLSIDENNSVAMINGEIVGSCDLCPDDQNDYISREEVTLFCMDGTTFQIARLPGNATWQELSDMDLGNTVVRCEYEYRDDGEEPSHVYVIYINDNMIYYEYVDEGETGGVTTPSIDVFNEYPKEFCGYGDNNNNSTFINSWAKLITGDITFTVDATAYSVPAGTTWRNVHIYCRRTDVDPEMENDFFYTKVDDHGLLYNENSSHWLEGMDGLGYPGLDDYIVPNGNYEYTA